MSLFRYRVFSDAGEVNEGFIEAGNEQEAASIMREKGFSIIFLRLAKTKGSNKVKETLSFFKKVKNKELVVFARQLSVMTSATLPIVQALGILGQQSNNTYFKKVIMDITDEVDGGSKLSLAMSRYPDIFNHFFISMVKSGETSGKIDEVMEYLADELEKDYDLVSRIKGAMIYPVFIVFGLVSVGILMMIFVIPKLTEILLQSGAKLPLTTRLLINTSNLFRNEWWLFFFFSVFFPSCRPAKGRLIISGLMSRFSAMFSSRFISSGFADL
jgi:type IV pilus assembly protein PilC